MPESPSHTTELMSQYSAQLAGDLENNAKEQDRLGAEIEALQEQLRALQYDHTVLVGMQRALGGGSSAEADTIAVPSVGEPAPAEPLQGVARDALTAHSEKTAPKKAAAKSSPAKTPKAAAKPTLVGLIRGHLEQQNEPRSAAEISSALGAAHPDRGIKTTVVRTTLEGLVAKSQAHRAKQGSSVFYTAATAPEPAAVEPQPQAVAG